MTSYYYVDVLKQHLSPVLHKRLSDADAVYADDLQGGLDFFLSKGGLSAELVKIFNLARSLLVYTLDNGYMTGGLLVPLLNSPDLEELANLLFPATRLQEEAIKNPTTFPQELKDVSQMNDVRARFLHDQPLLIMLALLRRGNFSLDERPQQIADCLMTAMIDQNLSLGDSNLLKAGKETFAADEEMESQKQLNDAELKASLNFIRCLKVLSSLVEDPEDVPRLYSQNVRTIRQITTQSKASFASQMANAAISKESALKIHDFAEGVDCWNEQLWLSLMRNRRADFGAFQHHPEHEEDENAPVVVKSKKSNNLTDILSLEEPTCEECCSVTSLSAYFADLLALLSNVAPQSNTLSPDEKAKNFLHRDNLLNFLSKRRPDLRKLELTCANSQTLIPYTSLVNEVLQSFIRFKNKSKLSSPTKDQGDSIQAYNNPVDLYQDSSADEHGAAVYRPGNIDHELYTKIIARQTAPFTIFPYNHARDMVSQYFSASRTNYADFVRVFQTPSYLLQTFKLDRTKLEPDIAESLTRGVREVYERQSTAEALSLQQFDFLAITGETFFPSGLADLIAGLSDGGIQITTHLAPQLIASLWGYADDDTMIDAASGKGLTFIRDELMKRSGMTFQDVMDLCRTQHFGQHLVITNKLGSPTFNERIGDLRLLSIAPPSPGSSPDLLFKPLTRELCRDLQAFMRLNAKLKWSIQDLDAAVYCLRVNERAISPGFKLASAYNAPPISVQVLRGIAYIVKLSATSGIEPSSLLPLWGPICSFGDSSLLKRLCSRTTPASSTQVAIDAKYFEDGTQKVALSAVINDVCNMLRWPTEHFAALASATDVSDAQLDLNSLSLLYRYVVVARLFQVPAKKCRAFFSTFFSKGQNDPLMSPKATFLSFQQWRSVLDSGWTIDSLTKILEPLDPQTTGEHVSPGLGLRLVSVLSEGAKEMEKTLYSLLDAPILTTDNITGCSSQVFDGATARLITQFVEGTQSFSASTKVAQKADLDKVNQRKWPNKLSINPIADGSSFKIDLTLSGILSTAEREDLLQGIPGLSAFNLRLADLVNQSLAPRSILYTRFDENPQSKKQLANSILLQDWPADEPVALKPISTPSGNELTPAEKAEKEARQLQKDAIQAEQRLQARRGAFIKLARPVIIQDLLTTLVVNTVNDILPGIDPLLLPLILSNVVQVSDDSSTSKFSALEAISTLYQSKESLDTTLLDAYFVPVATEDFIFTFTGDVSILPGAKVPPLRINGLEVGFDVASNTWTAARLVGRQYNLLQCALPVAHISWSTSKSMASAWTTGMLLDAKKVQYAERICHAIRRVTEISQMMELGSAELDYFNLPASTTGTQLSIDLNAPTLEGLEQLSRYNELKRSIGANSSEGHTFIGFSKWLSQTSSASSSTIASKMAACTGWNEAVVDNTLRAKYAGYKDSDLVTAVRGLDAMLELNTIVTLYGQLGSSSTDFASKPLISDLFNIAQPRPQLYGDADYTEAAKALQSRLTPSQKDKSDEVLTENQRQALVSYLLQQTYIKDDLDIWDADGLFEHFLIDVQMGPQIRTSRIKQAISVVQLFIQRCLLGMEKGVAKNALPREKWQWMQQYTMWEAHRKIFLYPENWIDPTLRDDKSALFNQFETSLMQKDLSIKSFSQAVQTYVYGLNEISSLDVVSYLHAPEVDSDVYHFFGRSRTAPYIFYYRTMVIYTLGHEIFWQPWSKIEMDVPSVETEWYGKRLTETGAYLLPILIGGRLYLFMPSISIKSISDDERTISAANDVRVNKQATSTAVMGELTKLPITSSRPDRIWEITMAWTELVNGTWSQKRVSSGSLSAASAASSSQFRFDPKFDQTKVTLDVSYSTNGDKARTLVGSFMFRDDQISAVATKPTTDATPFPTEFQKVVSKNFDPSSLLAPDTSIYPNGTPLVWTPKKLAGKSDMAWTLSKSRYQVTGLVITVKESDGTKVSYFNIPKVPLYKPDVTKPWDKNELASNMDLATIDHTFSHELMQATSDRIDPLESLYTYMANLQFESLRESYGAGSNSAWYHELGKPSAIYNWEIGLHAVLLGVDRFFSTQQFEEALQVARLVFDPTIEQKMEVQEDGTSKTETYQSCWRFPPFQDMARKMQKDGEASFDPLNLDHLQKELRLAISERRGYPALVHAAARGRPVAYMKWIMMKYAEILIAMGDVHFRTGRLEALGLATQRYIEATHVLGGEPPVIPDLAKRKKRAKTFAELRESDISFDLVSIEIGLPFARQLQRGAATEADADKRREKLRCFLRTDYFCTPLNPRFKQMRNLVHERLYNLRNSLDISGKPVVYALREPPIDPGRLMELSNQGNSISDVIAMVMGEQDGPLPRYRFDVLIRNALELCSELRGLGERLITAMEKKETEAFALIQARNSSTIQQMMHDIKKVQLEEAIMTVEALLITRSTHEAQLNYYLKLIGEPDSKIPKPKDTWVDIQQSIEEPTKDDLKMTSHEKTEMDMAMAASITSVIAAGIDGIVAPLAAIPQIEAYAAPLGVGASTSMGGSQLSSALAFGSVALKMASSILQEQGNRANRKSQLTKQLQERRMQANIHGREIKSIDKQVEIQNIRVRATNKEIEQAKVQWDHSVQTEQWYRSKYTNEQLYGWMEKSIRNLYFQAYTLALTMARRAEAAFAFDEGRNIRILRPEGYWDASRGGLLAADHLYLDLKRLEQAQINSGPSDFEISKTVSLREIDPMALLRLRATGSCEFTVGELLYDTDFPGHYMRRIKSVAMTIPAVIGPYSGISATMTLLSHKYRVDRSAANGKDYLASQGAGSEAFRFDRLPSTSIAISSGSSDPGVFELNFSGPTYMPFEGAGAISTWRLELPTTIRKFDHETISDVLLHVRYTAYNGGAVLKAAANDAVLQTAKAAERKSQGFWALWDLKNDFSSEWYGFSSKLLAAKKAGSDASVEASLGDIQGRLPFYARQASVQVSSISLISLDQQLITNMKVSVLGAEGNADLSTIGAYSVRTFKTEVAKLDDWAVSATRHALLPKADSVSNVYMIIHYVLAGQRPV